MFSYHIYFDTNDERNYLNYDLDIVLELMIGIYN